MKERKEICAKLPLHRERCGVKSVCPLESRERGTERQGSVGRKRKQGQCCHSGCPRVWLFTEQPQDPSKAEVKPRPSNSFLRLRIKSESWAGLKFQQGCLPSVFLCVPSSLPSSLLCSLNIPHSFWPWGLHPCFSICLECSPAIFKWHLLIPLDVA